jgi:HSP20 family protein
MTMWDPIRELQALPRWRLAFLPGRAARQYPLVNLHDDGDDVYIEALMPGVEPQGVEVTVVGNTLTLSGHKPGPQDLTQERIHRTERAAGRFMRTVQLPVEVDRDRAVAEYRNGLLLLKMPRSESSKPRRITIQEPNQEVRNDGN